MPVAVNCCFRLRMTDGLTGVTAIESRAGAVTVRIALLLVMLPEAARMLVVPAARAVARPAELMIATLVFELVQIAVAVRLGVELSV